MTEKAIWKYPLSIDPEQTIRMPSGARLLHVAIQKSMSLEATYETACLWAQVYPAGAKAWRHIVVEMTGSPFSHNLPYVGTFQIGPFVGHVFDAGER